MSLHCFIDEQAPVPGSSARAVHYPVCEWVDEERVVDPQHPFNRFLCSWMTSDISELTRCDEVLSSIDQLEKRVYQEWFADGDAFNVDFKLRGVQFNQSNVQPQDALHWNQREGQFALSEVKKFLLEWREFLAQLPVHGEDSIK